MRDLTPADLELLASEREVKQPLSVPQKLRERHHHAARCFAQGMKPVEVAAVTGFATMTVYILNRDPSFRGLVEHYRQIEDSQMADFTERATNLTLGAMNRLQEAFEDDENPVSVSMALEVFKAGADRIGHAPVQKSVSLNASVNLGSRLSAARQRLAAQVGLTLIESGDSVADRGSTE